MELGGYYGAFEEVLAWLLEAEERLADTRPPDGDELAQLKEHFHAHEVSTDQHIMPFSYYPGTLFCLELFVAWATLMFTYYNIVVNLDLFL